MIYEEQWEVNYGITRLELLLEELENTNLTVLEENYSKHAPF